MDAYLKKEQIGTLFVWVEALEGGFGGWVVPQGCPPQKVDMPSQNKNLLSGVSFSLKAYFTFIWDMLLAMVVQAFLQGEIPLHACECCTVCMSQQCTCRCNSKESL